MSESTVHFGDVPEPPGSPPHLVEDYGDGLGPNFGRMPVEAEPEKPKSRRSRPSGRSREAAPTGRTGAKP